MLQHQRGCGALVIFAIVLRVATARADEMQVHLQVRPQEPTSKAKLDAPMIEATIVDGPNVPLDKLTLFEANSAEPVALRAIAKREYVEGTDPIAIAFVISGQEIWIGNEDVEKEEAMRYEGVLKSLSSAIDRLRLGTAGPPGSKGVIISYSQGASIKLAMSPLDELTGAALGSQADYRGKSGTDMAQGITLGIAELTKTTTVRKALVVIGDGHDTNDDAAKSQLVELRKQAAKQKIELFAVIYRSAVSRDGVGPITSMIPAAKTANSFEGMAAEMSSVIERIRNRYYVTFAGYDKRFERGLPWDGKQHDLVVKIDQRELEPFPIVLLPRWKPPARKAPTPWLAIVAAIGAALLVMVLGVRLSRRKPVPLSPSVVAAPLPEVVLPGGPMTTVMIGAGGEEGGFPVVGWLVPLNGQLAFQTRRIRSGGSKIGTAPPADIIINDGFMSTQHAQILCSPSGFTLVDDGSTNGCYVNDRKVVKHELVDNDVITLGKTDFRFKTIN